MAFGDSGLVLQAGDERADASAAALRPPDQHQRVTQSDNHGEVRGRQLAPPYRRRDSLRKADASH
jgi:hypothetical protein